MTAEGVETEQQLKLLAKDRCDEVRGYYLSRPLDRQHFECLLKARSDQRGAL